jgi:hypothetical protein
MSETAEKKRLEEAREQKVPCCPRAYPCGKSGMTGISDDKQHLCFAPARWDGRDAIQGNHGAGGKRP